MKPVELIYAQDCPNVIQTRTNLLCAFPRTGITARWVEWDCGDSSSPPHVRSYGSPTILIDGKDIAGEAPSENISCCRRYAGENGEFGQGAPSVKMIVAALSHDDKVPAKVEKNKSTGGWQVSIASLPGIGASPLAGRSLLSLLARLRRSVEQFRVWVPDEEDISSAANGSFSYNCSGWFGS